MKAFLWPTGLRLAWKPDKEDYEQRAEAPRTDIRIALPERHWVVLLAILDQAIDKSVRPGIEKLKKKGIKLTEITDEQATTLAGPLMIRGAIVKELVSRGVMKPEAQERLGIDKLMEAAEKFRIFPDKK